MAAVTFASELKDDGSLVIPKYAVEELGIHPGDHVRVRVEAVNETGDLEAPTMLSRAKHLLTHRTADQVAAAQALAIEKYQPVRAIPPGKTLADVVSGQWPGDESDEQIDAALKDLS